MESSRLRPAPESTLSLEAFADRFRRAELLPQLPTAAVKLVATLDDPECSAAKVEQILSADPALVATLLRTASSAAFASHSPVTTVPMAVMRLGFRLVRTVAISFSLQAMLSKPSRQSRFRPARFARHSAYVSAAAQARVLAAGGSVALSQEVFACGMVHDLALALLARVAPDAFDLTEAEAREEGLTFAEAFEARFGCPLATLGQSAVRAWGLPEVFEDAVAHALVDPSPLALALTEADGDALQRGYAYEDWDLVHVSPAEAPDAPELGQAVDALMRDCLGEAA